MIDTSKVLLMSFNAKKYNKYGISNGIIKLQNMQLGPLKKVYNTNCVSVQRFWKFGLGISAMALFFRSTARAAAVCQKLAAPSANAAVNSLSHQKVFISHGLGPWVRVYTFCMYLINLQ